jgi:hypothetical protein
MRVLGLGVWAAVFFLIQSGNPGQVPSGVELERAVNKLRLEGVPLTYHRVFGVERVYVINMIPNAQSEETGQDSEPNLAIDPSDRRHMVGSAFTDNPTGSNTSAPVFISTDSGITWSLTNIVPSGNGMTGDISLDFAREDHTLYAGILRGGSGYRQMILRSSDPFAGTMMTTLTDHSTRQFDQPYVTAITTKTGGANQDRVFVGFNELDNWTGAGGTGRTASVERSQNARTALPPAGLSTTRLEARATAQQDMPAIRCAVHSSGVVYSVFYRWATGALPNAVCDVVVCRDDNFASGASPYADLVDPGDNVAGRIVAANRTVPAFPAFLGQNRLVASNLSIAVNPNNPAAVYIAYADRVGTGDYTLHVRRSTDSGATWSGDLITIVDATNPALAVNSSGVVGFLYQALRGAAPNQNWETHLQRSSDGCAWSDMILADTPDSTPALTFQPYIGDYCDLIAEGKTFYGIFSASNTPDQSHFPQGIQYQRNADFTTQQLRNLANTANVAVSIDPFFFKVIPPTIIDICKLYPERCGRFEFDRGRLDVIVDRLPFEGVDFIPQNCLRKWDCPGCRGMSLCPPYYHIYFEGIDPMRWKIGLYSKNGEPAPHQVHEFDNGLVLSFRPSKKLYREKEIGDYYLGIESIQPVSIGRHSIRTRLEVSDYPYKEHIKRMGRPF